MMRSAPPISAHLAMMPALQPAPRMVFPAATSARSRARISSRLCRGELTGAGMAVLGGGEALVLADQRGGELGIVDVAVDVRDGDRPGQAGPERTGELMIHVGGVQRPPGLVGVGEAAG